MNKFPESKYYLVKIFYKLPTPFLLWPLFILLVFLIGEYLTMPHLDIKAIISNAFFSISALFITVIIYERAIRSIENWILKYKLIYIERNAIFLTLNNIHHIIFNRITIFLSLTVVIIRKLIAVEQDLQPDVLGGIVHDTITQFLISSLILSSIGIIICLYIISSHGIETKSPFEIKPAYENIYNTVIINTFIVGVELGIFGAAVLGWAKSQNQMELGILCNILIIGSIPIIFFTGLFGIRNGINSSKNYLLSRICSEMKRFDILEFESSSELYLRDKNIMESLYIKLSSRAKNVIGVNPWMLDITSLISVGFTLITSTAINNIILRLIQI